MKVLQALLSKHPAVLVILSWRMQFRIKWHLRKFKTKSGNFITPNIASTSAAGNVQLPADSKIFLGNTDAADGYPISGFTWAFIYKEQVITAVRRTGRKTL